jgi:transcriptional regulator with XRE-family HTH domain
MDRPALAEFLRARREALQPSDVGMPPGARRRTAGLRREEIAAVVGMSADYWARLEQRRGPQPSDQMLTAIARGLRLDLDERDHLFRLAGHETPRRARLSPHVSPGLMRVLDRLDDTPALVITELGETLAQNRLAAALFGDATGWTGLDRSGVHRWFAHPEDRGQYPERDHERQGRLQVAQLRVAASMPDPDPLAAQVLASLLATSAEFRGYWDLQEVGSRFDERKTLRHPEVGEIEVHCQALFTEDQSQVLLVLTPLPGSGAAEALGLLGVVGEQRFERS